MKIVEFVKLLDRRPIISAFTATATQTVREDIVCILGLKDPYILVNGFDRENLFFQVEKPQNKDQYILDYISQNSDQSGIIYCSTRKKVEEVYDLLKSKGISVAKYHAGMGSEERKKMQDDFVFDYVSIVVATNAFGMGIDKSNVRFVIHYNMPQSMENYYQEAGRAGRDGLDAKCILLFSPQDIVINRFLLEHKDMSDLDPIDKETVRQLDIKRLQAMERYCYTTECLRNYILKYFGENPKKPCGDCGNCLREFETMDMTDQARKVINCVYEVGQRYGKTIILDILTGAKTARLQEIGAFDLKMYGVLASTKKALLRRLLEQMVVEGYLRVGAYQVIKIANYSPLKDPDTTVLVKITDEDKKPEKPAKTQKKAKGMENLTAAGYRLFEKLRALRLEIAREESMPPYIIFSDKTLIDMANKVPTSKEELLKVSGVGENKYMKYGKRFLSLIEEYIEDNPELNQNKTQVDLSPETSHKTVANKKGRKQAFSLLKEEADNYTYVDFTNVSSICDEMNRICQRDNVKKIPATRLTRILVSNELIVEKEQDGQTKKVPTEKGEKLGIKEVERVSQKGNPYTILVYPPNIQRMLVEHFVREDNLA